MTPSASINWRVFRSQSRDPHSDQVRGHAFAEYALIFSNRQNVDVAERLLTPLRRQHRAYRAAPRLRHGIGIALSRPRQTLDSRDHDVEYEIVERLAGGIFFRNSYQINRGIVGQFALVGHRYSHKGAAGKRQAAPLDPRPRIRIFQDPSVLVEPSPPQFLDHCRTPRSQPDQIAILADQNLGNAAGPR